MTNPFESEEYLRRSGKGFTNKIDELTKDLKVGEYTKIAVDGMSYNSLRSLLGKKRFKGQFTTTKNKDGMWVKRLRNQEF